MKTNTHQRIRLLLFIYLFIFDKKILSKSQPQEFQNGSYNRKKQCEIYNRNCQQRNSKKLDKLHKDIASTLAKSRSVSM